MLWVTILTAFIVYLLWKALREEDPLDKLPGPKKWPIVGDAFHLAMLTQVAYFARVRQFVELYGDRFVFKIFHQRVLNILSAKDAEVVLSHSRNISKSGHYHFLQPWLGTGLLLSTGSKWHRRRKLLTPSFHFHVLKSFAVVMEERSRAFVRQLRNSPGETEVASLVKDFTLYTICETTMGIKLDLDKSQAALDYLEAVVNIGPLILQRSLSFWLQSDFIYKRLAVGKRFQNYLKISHSFADDFISKRKQQRIKDLEEAKDLKLKTTEEEKVKTKMAFLDLLLEVESRGEIDLEGIREEVNTFMFAVSDSDLRGPLPIYNVLQNYEKKPGKSMSDHSQCTLHGAWSEAVKYVLQTQKTVSKNQQGHDTTATALTFGIMLLADHPEVQDKIREEYRLVIGGSEHAFTMSHFAEMKYLEAVIKETLRLYPSVPFIARTITEDFMLDDLLVRAGTQVAVRIYDLQRRADLYPDPQTFKPERFLDPDHQPYAFVPFSAGPRNCIGQRFAMMEMKCVLGMICDNFRVEPRTPHLQPTLIADLVLRTVDPIYVKFVPR